MIGNTSDCTLTHREKFSCENTQISNCLNQIKAEPIFRMIDLELDVLINISQRKSITPVYFVILKIKLNKQNRWSEHVRFLQTIQNTYF